MYHINKLKNKTHTAIQLMLKRHLTKHAFMIKVLETLEINKTYLKIGKAIYSTHIARIILNRKYFQ